MASRSTAADASRSGVTDASMSRSTTRGPRADGARRRLQQQQEQRSAQEQQVRVTDPDNPEIDRTPQPLMKPHQSNRTLAARKVPGGPSASVAGGSDRRTSVQTGGEGGSVSIRTSHSEEKSTSQAEGSSTGSDQVSTSTPDDFTTDLFDESTSDSHSMERSSVSGPVGRRQSQISSSDGVSVSAAETSGKTGGAAAEKSSEPKAKLTADPRLNIFDANLGRTKPPKEWTQDAVRVWRQGEVMITLSETPLMFLFNKQDEAVPNTAGPEAEAVRKRNQRYEDFVKNKKENESGGRYVDRGVTTLNEPSFSAKAEALPPAVANAGMVQVTPYDLHDALLKANEEEVETEEGVVKTADGGAEGDDDAGAARDGEDDGGDDNDAEDGGRAGGGSTSPRGKRSAAWLASPSLLETVLIVERCIVMNNYEELQLAYRGLPMEALTDHIPVADSLKPSSPVHDGRRQRRDYSSNLQSDERDALDETRRQQDQADKKEQAQEKQSTASKSSTDLQILWSFGGEATRGKNVTSLAWNRKNPDILAAGYGEYGVPGADEAASAKSYGGVVNCWSVKNPFTPERTIQMESEAGVSALHFSRQHPSLLAVGSTDGTLALYDVRVHGNTPALKTTVSTGQHTGTIWEVRWVDKGQERGETLISISADGHVMEWSIKKGLERTADLMKLKRAPATDGHGAAAGIQNNKGAPKEALLARQSGGMCFDINPREPITYVVGTEDGTIHKCSKSQNENYIMTYKPHGEPVYRIRWSPFCPDYFLTASADWTSRLYNINKADPLAVYDSLDQDAVQDLCWSHTNSTIFATATAQGRLDIWDIGTPNQRTTSLELKKQLNCLLFAEQESPLLTCGDINGDVTVVKLKGEVFERRGTDKEQEDRLRDVISHVAVA